MISGFRCEVDENGALLSYYAASSGNLTTTHCVLTEKNAVLDILHELKH